MPRFRKSAPSPTVSVGAPFAAASKASARPSSPRATNRMLQARTASAVEGDWRETGRPSMLSLAMMSSTLSRNARSARTQTRKSPFGNADAGHSTYLAKLNRNAALTSLSVGAGCAAAPATATSVIAAASRALFKIAMPT